MQLCDVTADGDGFQSRGAVVQYQHRNTTERVIGSELVTQVPPKLKIDRLAGALNSFLGNEDADTARVRGSGGLE